MFLLFYGPHNAISGGTTPQKFVRSRNYFVSLTEKTMVPLLTATHLISRLGKLNLRPRATREWTHIRKQTKRTILCRAEGGGPLPTVCHWSGLVRKDTIGLM